MSSFVLELIRWHNPDTGKETIDLMMNMIDRPIRGPSPDWLLRIKILRLAFFIPLICGFIGLRLLNEGSVPDCLYKSFQLYTVEYNIQSHPINGWVEFARWTAPLATGAVIVSFLLAVLNRTIIRLKVRDPSVVVLHGDSRNTGLIKDCFGRSMIETDDPLSFKARTHVLMFDDDSDLYDFLERHGSGLLCDEKNRIIICSDDIKRGSYNNDQFKACNTAENCARNYWKSWPVRNKHERILLFGFDNYGQNLLNQGILKNVIAADSNIEYHIVGDYKEYLGKHKCLHKAIHVKIHGTEGDRRDHNRCEEICGNNDTIYFYDIPWYEIVSQRDEFDRVILCYDDDTMNIRRLAELTKYYSFSNYFLRFPDEKLLNILWNVQEDHITVFGEGKEMFSPEVVLKEKLLLQAKKINARYYSRYTCKEQCAYKDTMDTENGLLSRCVGCPWHRKDWDNLNSFVRYSNVAQADHIPEKVWLILNREADLDENGLKDLVYQAYMKLDQSQKVKLWQIEHLRWNRYHFLNNWDYAEKRDNSRRKHHLLVPFDKLPYEELQKDEDAYLALKDLLN